MRYFRFYRSTKTNGVIKSETAPDQLLCRFNKHCHPPAADYRLTHKSVTPYNMVVIIQKVYFGLRALLNHRSVN